MSKVTILIARRVTWGERGSEAGNFIVGDAHSASPKMDPWVAFSGLNARLFNYRAIFEILYDAV